MTMNLQGKLGYLRDMFSASQAVSVLVCGAVIFVLLTPSESLVVVQREPRHINRRSIDYERLLEQAEMPGVNSDIHNLSTDPVDHPECHVEISEPRRIGGKCGQIRGGPTYCAVRGFVYVNHEDCLQRP